MREAALAPRPGITPALVDAVPVEVLEQGSSNGLKGIPVVTLR